MRIDDKLLDNCMDKVIGNKHVFSTVLRVESGDGHFAWAGSRGEMKPDSKYFITSVTKLYVTAVVMALIEEQKFTLDDKIAKFLPPDCMENLHVFKGTDYSDEITVKHLISNTSGLPDYFFYKERGKKSVADSLFQGHDASWDFDRTIGSAKKMTPKFAPGSKRKAAYSDTNYQLLEKIIETVTGNSIGNVFKERVFDKLGLCSTYVYSDVADNEPSVFYYRDKQLWLPNYMASISCEGGIVSTADEVMIFLKAFFAGQFFPKEKIESLKKWNLIFPPPALLYFGIGLEKWFNPRFMSPIKPIKEVIGFWGQTSAFAWYNPDTDLYFTGTANQAYVAGHNAMSKAMLKIIKAVQQKERKS